MSTMRRDTGRKENEREKEGERIQRRGGWGTEYREGRKMRRGIKSGGGRG